jgi:hypothetical protein
MKMTSSNPRMDRLHSDLEMQQERSFHGSPAACSFLARDVKYIYWWVTWFQKPMKTCRFSRKLKKLVSTENWSVTIQNKSNFNKF